MTEADVKVLLVGGASCAGKTTMAIRTTLLVIALVTVACGSSKTDSTNNAPAPQPATKEWDLDGIYCFDLVRGDHRDARYLCTSGFKLCEYSRKSMIEAVNARYPEVTATGCALTTEKVYCFESRSEGRSIKTCSDQERVCKALLEKSNANPDFYVLSTCTPTGGESTGPSRAAARGHGPRSSDE